MALEMRMQCQGEACRAGSSGGLWQVPFLRLVNRNTASHQCSRPSTGWLLLFGIKWALTGLSAGVWGCDYGLSRASGGFLSLAF